MTTPHDANRRWICLALAAAFGLFALYAEIGRQFASDHAELLYVNLLEARREIERLRGD